VRNGKLTVVSRDSRLGTAAIRCQSTVTSLNQKLVNQPVGGAVVFPFSYVQSVFSSHDIGSFLKLVED
jgi:hypothetical protein